MRGVVRAVGHIHVALGHVHVAALCGYVYTYERPFSRSQGHISSVQTISKSHSRCVLTATRCCHSHTCIIPKAHDALMLHGSQHKSHEDGCAL